MKIKNVLFGFLALLMVLATVAGALAANDDISLGDANVGDVDYNVNIDSMSWWDKLKMEFSGGQAFTVIDGATCSVYPDKSQEYTPYSSSVTRLCYTNNDHVGVAYQLFEVDGGWKFLGEKQVSQGDKECFSVEYGKDYHYTLYFCDNTAQRTCTDTDGGKDYYEKGTNKFTIDGESTTVSDKCVASNKLQEVYCDSDNSLASVTKDCTCSNGACVSSATPGHVKITLKNIEVTNDGDLTLNQKYTVLGKAYIDGECNDCVIETGQGYYGQALALTSSKGACGDDNTVGIKFDAKNEWIEFKLYDIATKEGKFNVEIGAYNGCYKDLKDDLRKLDSEKFTVDVTEPQVDSDPEVDDDKTNDVTCYFCMADELISATYDDSCPDGTFDSEVECGLEVDEPSCSNDPDSESCQAEDTGKSPTQDNPVVSLPDYDAPELSWNEKYFDFENNPKTAYSLVGLAVIVVILIIAILMNSGGKKRRR